MKMDRLLIAAALTICISGCGQDQLPFEAVYTSRDTVSVTYQGRQHVLNRHDGSKPTPFQYRFEDDGDLDLFVDGRAYEIESPYDLDGAVDRKKTRKSASASKTAKTSKSSSRSSKKR